MDLLEPGSTLPQRAPILMLDRVVNIVPGESGTGVRRFVEGDPCFEGHFPGRPILPGVLAVEACAQTALAVALAGAEAGPGGAGRPLGFLAKINNMSFYKTIEPGQEVHFKARVKRKVGSFIIVACEAARDGELCARGELTLAVERA